MRLAFLCAAVISALSISNIAAAQSTASAASAAPALKLETDRVIRSSDGAWVGPINYVEKGKDGSPEYVGVIRDGRMLHIEASTLSEGPKGLVTSLKISDVDKLP
jgi:hypothetical protein